ncbi:hypothetical protein BDP27DRAFT_1412259 [Rhodocollybia butyracea]|uniref:Uncharacterized protein n=1 Tax=Rhodocollybia butyracea TaxID=206335 RepID=A0A9P5TUA6_9AGAR|nr:hypothetical protein BDP27DRAFT_1412259 [Rhodocollybia butyracea]
MAAAAGDLAGLEELQDMRMPKVTKRKCELVDLPERLWDDEDKGEEGPRCVSRGTRGTRPCRTGALEGELAWTVGVGEGVNGEGVNGVGVFDGMADDQIPTSVAAAWGNAGNDEGKGIEWLPGSVKHRDCRSDGSWDYLRVLFHYDRRPLILVRGMFPNYILNALFATPVSSLKKSRRGIRLNQTEAAALIDLSFRNVFAMAKNLLQISNNTERISWDEGMYYQVFPACCTRFKWKGLLSMASFLSLYPILSVQNLEILMLRCMVPLPSIPDESIVFPFQTQTNMQAKRCRSHHCKEGPIVINKGKEAHYIKGYKQRRSSVQIGSHYHFIETNSHFRSIEPNRTVQGLTFPSGNSSPFRTGDTKKVTLCSFAGGKIISGGNGLATGIVDLGRTDEIISNLVQRDSVMSRNQEHWKLQRIQKLNEMCIYQCMDQLLEIGYDLEIRVVD